MDSPCTQLDRRDRGSFFERFASRATYWAGSTPAFILAVMGILLWLAVGHHFAYSETWQLVVNTGTTIVTFLMVFLVQRSQNRESLALKVQMDELISSLKEANNTVIDLDDLSEQQLLDLHRRYQQLSREPGSLPNVPDPPVPTAAVQPHASAS